MKKRNERSPEDVIQKKERARRIETEVVGAAAAGAGAGAGVGAIVGLPGVVAGVVIGAAVGALAGIETERVEHAKAEHEKELDNIGLDSEPPTRR